MTEIMHFPSASSSITSSSNDGFHQQQSFMNNESFINSSSSNNSTSTSPVALYRRNNITSIHQQQQQVEETEEGVLAVLATVLRKSLVGCKSVGVGVVEEYKQRIIGMEIGCPTNVRHVAHVTFDRFNGFLGLPVEFEPDVPRRPPSASTRVFGVSTESMQLSYDTRGNCVPTILLMMQRRLYSQGGLQSEGIFRINPENSQEEFVRQQLNNGLIPDNIDVHCLAGLIKAWFRELPKGVLDCLSPELVMQANTEEECVEIVRLLSPTESALFDWAVNLMADVAQMEHLNKMNARNIAMVFAPNMTHMSDPLTALMYAVQVMNFLKNLVVKILRVREDSRVEAIPLPPYLEPSDEEDRHNISKPRNQKSNESDEEAGSNSPKETLPTHITNPSSLTKAKTEDKAHGFLSSIENIIPQANGQASGNSQVENVKGNGSTRPRSRRTKSNQGQPSNSSNSKRESRTYTQVPVIMPIKENGEKRKEISNICRVDSHSERVEAWR